MKENSMSLFSNRVLNDTGIEQKQTIFKKMRIPAHDRLCLIWCHLYDLKTVKTTYGGVLLLVLLLSCRLELGISDRNQGSWIEVIEMVTNSSS